MPDLTPSPASTTNKSRGVPATAVIIFGASGDLTARKLMPALYNLQFDKLLPNDFYLFGFGRKPLPDSEFQTLNASHIKDFSRRPFVNEKWNPVLSKTFYHTGNYDNLSDFTALKEKIDKIEKDIGQPLQLLFYLSTPPTVFKPILENLGNSGLARRYPNTKLTSKVIIEKPFGRDLASARELNTIITQQFQENQVFRIDHYLGKETVQDLLVLRFANSIFEPIWNLNYINYVEITVAESLGVGKRSSYYDQSGALRDMIQNHIMQLLSLIAMEPPISTDPEDIRNEKVKLLKAIQPIKLAAEGGDVIRGQYEEGLIAGEKVPGYLQEAGVQPDSFTETFVALKLLINNWRWNGVPFYIRSGKRMARRVSEIAIHFKYPHGSLFKEASKYDLIPNTLAIQIQPDEGSALILNCKVPGLETRTQPIKMHFRYATTFGSETPEAYERLILDAMLHDNTLFIRSDEAETSWKLCTPILDFWKECRHHGLEKYAAGSWGPTAAAELLWNDKHEWRKIDP